MVRLAVAASSLFLSVVVTVPTKVSAFGLINPLLRPPTSKSSSSSRCKEPGSHVTPSSLFLQQHRDGSPLQRHHRRQRFPTPLVVTKMSCCDEHDDTTTNPSSSNNQLPQLNLYNSLSRTKVPFHPIKPPHVTMYTCGPTVYDYAHVGNFRAFLTYDILKRVLQYFGYDVDHVCNLTDVDDKIIARCDREDVGLLELTRKFENLFMADLDALNIVRARVYPRATDHIEDMVTLIQDLEKQGLAYQSDEGSWYFNVGAKDGYGKQLVNLDCSNMQTGASNAGSRRGTDADEYDADKVGVRDFALWKAYKPNFDREDATWDTDIGKGRPGWHLECSAMARRYLGDTIDVHCGGVDLKFPHHENEIAQSEGATGKTFCNCWIHNGFVNLDNEKMSKSKGNFFTLRGACPKNDDIRAYRYLVVSSQYRNPLSFTEDAMSAAKGALKRMDRIREQIDVALAEAREGGVVVTEEEGEESSEIVNVVQREISNFEEALKDDLSMPRASASLFGVIKAAENEFKRLKKAEKQKLKKHKKIDDKSEGDDSSAAKEASDDDVPTLDVVGLKSVKEAMERMDQVFGVFYTVPKAKDEDGKDVTTDGEDELNGVLVVPEEVMDLVSQRSAAKNEKNWELADSLRSQIGELGFAVKDVKGGEPLVSRLD